MSGAVMHGNRATQSERTCTAPVHDERAHLAPFFVQHRERLTCTVAVQLTLHACGATQDNLPRELQNPSCTACKKAAKPPTESAYDVTQIGDFRVTHRPRAWSEAPA